MRVLLAILSLTCAVASGAPGASAGQRWSPRQPASPALTENLEPELCEAVLGATRRWFDSDLASEIALTPEDIGVEAIEWETGETAAGNLYRKSLDLDGDGEPERVVITGRYFREHEGFDGLVLPSEDAVAELIAQIRPDDGHRQPSVPAGGFRFFPRYDSQLSNYSFYPLRVFSWRDRFYYVANQGEGSATVSLAVARFDGRNEFPIVCRISSPDPKAIESDMRAVPEISALLMSLNFIDGGLDYCGTSRARSNHNGWVSDWMSLAAVRPWASVFMDERALVPRGGGNSPAFWDFLEAWGSGDPWSQREYLTLREAVGPARHAYANYLVDKFGLPAARARVEGDMIVDNLLSVWIDVPASDAYEFAAAPSPTSPASVNEFGKTSLMMAAHMNRLDHVRELLSRGANPNAITESLQQCGYHIERGQRTALLYAAENASPLVMKALLDAGAKLKDIDSTPTRGTPYLAVNPRLTREQQQTPLDELAAGAANLADAPGFDCKRARSGVEKAICANETLRMLDAEMARAYERALPTNGTILREGQTAWNSRRARQCGPRNGQAQVNCIASLTAARERYLHRLERR